MPADLTVTIGGDPVEVSFESTAEAKRQADISTAGAALAEAWAEGTEPGGASTKSAKEWAQTLSDERYQRYLTTDNFLKETTSSITANNGASFSGRQVTIAALSTGNSSVLREYLDIDDFTAAFPGWQVGTKIRIFIAAKVSDTWTRTEIPLLRVRKQAGLVTEDRPEGTEVVREIANLVVFAYDYTLRGDENQFRPQLTLTTGSSTAVAETIEIIGYRIALLDSKTRDITAETEMAETREVNHSAWIARYMETNKAGIHDEIITVSPGGGADFTDPQVAAASITDASLAKRYKLDIAPGRYETGAELAPTDYVDLIGRGKRDCIILFYQPDSSTAAQIDTNSVVRTQWNHIIKGLGFWGWNVRYCWHPEIPVIGEKARIPILDVSDNDFFHFGNPSGNNQRSPTSMNACGGGCNPGQIALMHRNHFWAKHGSAWAFHNNKDYDEPCFLDVWGNTFSPGQDSLGRSVSVGILGSTRGDVLHLRDNSMGGGKLYINVATWSPTAASNKPANHQDFEIVCHGNTPFTMDVNDDGVALRITSASTGAASSVELSGDAVKHLFGDTASDNYRTIFGSAGRAAAVYGWGDISNLGISLGARLGDCTVTSKTLTVTIDGGAAIDIVFSSNHTAQSNATVIAAINAALGASGTADSFSPGDLYRPVVTDEEEWLRNGSATLIARTAVLAYDGDTQTVRLMTSADDASLFAGIAMDDIPAGERRRVKVRGWMPLADINTAVGSVTFNATMSVGATPGQVAAGGTQGLLRAVRTDAVKVA